MRYAVPAARMALAVIRMTGGSAPSTRVLTSSSPARRQGYGRWCWCSCDIIRRARALGLLCFRSVEFFQQRVQFRLKPVRDLIWIAEHRVRCRLYCRFPGFSHVVYLRASDSVAALDHPPGVAYINGPRDS